MSVARDRSSCAGHELAHRVVMAASALPDPREISYDILLRCVLGISTPLLLPRPVPSQILAYLDLFGRCPSFKELA